MTKREIELLRCINWSGCSNEDWGILPDNLLNNAASLDKAALYTNFTLATRIKEKTGYKPSYYMHVYAFFELDIEPYRKEADNE